MRALRNQESGIKHDHQAHAERVTHLTACGPVDRLARVRAKAADMEQQKSIESSRKRGGEGESVQECMCAPGAWVDQQVKGLREQ
jgi:hypothetical protein